MAPRRDVEAVQRRHALDLRLEDDGLRVGRPLEVVDPVAESLGQDARRRGLAIVERQAEEIRLVARAATAAGRRCSGRRGSTRAALEGRVGRREVPGGRGRGIQRRRSTGRCWSSAPRPSRAWTRPPARGRPARRRTGTVRRARTAGVSTSPGVRSRTGPPSTSNAERVRPLAVLPVGPVPVEQRVGHVGLQRSLHSSDRRPSCCTRRRHRTPGRRRWRRRSTPSRGPTRAPRRPSKSTSPCAPRRRRRASRRTGRSRRAC